MALCGIFEEGVASDAIFAERFFDGRRVCCRCEKILTIGSMDRGGLEGWIGMDVWSVVGMAREW